MTQELRKLAEATLLTEQWYTKKYLDNKIGNGEDSAYIAAANPAAILALLDRLEKAEKDAARWNYAVAIGENQTMNWLDVYDDWDGDGDFTAQIDRAMEASK